jgi:UPF0755 protein
MNKKIIIVILVFLAVAFLTAVFLPKNFSDKKVFTIKSGERTGQIAENLKKEGLIYWGTTFRVYIFISGDSKKIKAGTYLLDSSMNLRELVNKFVEGDIAKEKITFPEGYTAEQVYQKIAGFT